MQTTTEQITTTFAPETQFDIPPRPAQRQDEAIPSSETLAARETAPLAGPQFTPRGVPTSPLHD